MKIKGLLRTYTKDKKIYDERILLKLYNDRTVLAEINDTKLLFYLPLITEINLDKPIYYELTKPQPLNQKFKIPESNTTGIEHQYLIVKIR